MTGQRFRMNGQPKRCSESVLSTSSADGVESGNGDSTSPDPSTSDVHHSKLPRLGAPVDEDPQQHLDPIPVLPGVGVSTVGTPAGTATLLAVSTLFTPTNQPPPPSVPPHYSHLPPLIPIEHAHNPITLQGVLRNFADAATSCGLIVNTAKTKVPARCLFTRLASDWCISALCLQFAALIPQRKERGEEGNTCFLHLATFHSALQDALKEIQDGKPLKTVSRIFGIPCKTLRRHRDGKVKNPAGAVLLGRFRPDFDEKLETMLVTHVQEMEKALFGLTTNDVRRLAFDFADKLSIPNRFCKTSRMAGKDWLSGFLQRNPQLSVRKPEATSMSRAVGFNRPQVETFFKVYREVLSEGNYSPRHVWNMDETGITTVQKPVNIVATKGAKSVGRITSGERGQTTSVLFVMNAAGTYLPPMFIFARKRTTTSYDWQPTWINFKMHRKWMVRC
ncbi:hypothetical protein Pcinc_020265 [Petrolisthes cinctipes]|uniref:HTH CENPB-type domain-containing protein n=1 Tax=Petrolisthes cinctipes TaxID=88211 RepID=A0AAE1FIF8_PETCI|nr:hypothetical protein Pcinc_020265 [Petrolisthes cinctipes]